MFPSMIIVPLLQICWTLFSIIEGLLYFQEYKGFTPTKAVMFSVGVLVIFVGVFILTKNAGKDKDKGYEKMQQATADESKVCAND